MKINAVTPYKNQALTTKKEAFNQKPKNTVTNSIELTNDYTKLAFMGTKKDRSDVKNLRDMKANFTPEADDVYEKAQEYAKATGAKEIESWHFYLASLESLKEYITNLNNGVVKHEEERRLKLPFEVETLISQSCNLFGNEKQRAKIEAVVDKHITPVKANFTSEENTRKIKIPFLSTPQPAKEAIEDLVETYDVLANELQTNNFFDSYFHTMAHFSKDKKLVKEAKNFVKDIQAAIMVEDKAKKEKNHLKFYDEKADAIWKNLSIGNDAICIYSADDRESSKYLISSFINLINKPGQVYKNIDPENTEIIELNNLGSFDFLNKIVKDAKTNPEYKDKTVVFIANMIDLIKNQNGYLNEEDIKTLINETKHIEGDNRNIRLVFTITPESYYANTAKTASLAYPLSHYAVQTLPSLNASDAINFLTDENGLKYVENETKGSFSKKTIVKAIELTAQEDGNYPGKAVNLLSSAKKYFIDKEKITEEDLEKFTNETRGLSEVNNSSDGTSVIFDTGKRLTDIVGSPMTKADAEALINQIKSKTVGTKGYSIFLDNGTSYGGGRKHTAQAIAGEAGIPMITINAQDYALKDIDTLSQNANYSEMKIKKIVSLAKAQAEANQNKTAMIFIENFDNFASNPLYGVSSIYEQKAFSQLLLEMENARKNEDINLIVIGSMNMPELLDENIMKPYKFLNSIIVFPPQDPHERKEVIEYYINKMGIEVEGETQEEKDKILRDISETTKGFTVVDLMYLLETAKGVMVEEGKDKIGENEFIEAFLRTTSGRPNKAMIPESTKKVVASHEAGHAIALQIMYEIAQKQNIEWRLPSMVNFITLDPRANYGGAMYYKDPNNHEYGFERIFTDMICSYGGHSAEKEIYGMSGSWGITADMRSAESTARSAVLDMGMGPKTGVRHIRRNSLGSPDVSEEKMRHIEQDIDSLHKSAKFISDDIIKAYKDFILEFTQKYYSKVATGECLVPSEDFIQELNAWRERQPEEKQKALLELEKEILDEIERVKEGK